MNSVNLRGVRASPVYDAADFSAASYIAANAGLATRLDQHRFDLFNQVRGGAQSGFELLADRGRQLV